ncbi:hypothetical protein [Pseudomonas sp. C11]|uniref:hypothetical protein n=1 Tax=Pseudomonas sp. C11 TaxID=3075550 RepID=UPI002AFDE178|nr:hypothetical protein [Pseudomonas sp. C11]
MSIRADAPTRTDEASLGDLFIGILNFYLKQGRWVLLIALLCTAPIVFWVANNPIYQLTALLDTPTLSLDKWRQIEPILPDKALIQNTLEKNLADSDEDERQRLAGRFGNPEFWKNSVRYRSALRRDDIQDAPSANLQKASTLGLELSIRASNDDQSKRLQQLMISQIREAMMLEGARSLINDWQNLIIDKRPELQVQLFEKQVDIQLNRSRIEDMQQLLAQYPELRQIERNTLVSVQGGGGRYLSPLAQIVALESTISEDNSLIKKTEYELERLGLYEQVISNIDESLPLNHSGHDLAQQLITRANQLQQANVSSLAATEVSSDVLNQVQSLLSKPQLLQLKATTDLPATPILSRRPLIVGAGIFGLVFFGSSILLALYQLIRRQVLPLSAK